MREIRMLRTTWRKLETGRRNGLRHRQMAKASGKQQLPVPVATAPAFDPTEWRTEASPTGRLLRPDAGNPHAAYDMAGVGNGVKGRTEAPEHGESLRPLPVPVTTAPAFDPT